jgi:quercetin dioxygenase-like cupin family protein
MKQRAGAMVMPVAAVGLLLLVGSVPAVLPPGAKEKLHSHPAYVIHVVAGGKMRNHAVDGSTSEIEFKTGDTIYRDPLTHWAENIGNTTIRLVLVELKGSAP